MILSSLRALLLPRSLLGQFRLALSALVFLIVAGGLTAIHSLRVITDSSRNLAEVRLTRLQDAQGLVQRTLLIERLTYRLLTAESRADMRSHYAEIISRLESLDVLVAQLGQAEGDISVLNLHQVSQLFRNTTHIVVRLHEEMLPDETASGTITTRPGTRVLSAPQQPSERLEMHRHFHAELEAQVVAMTAVAEELSAHYTRDYREAVRHLSETSRQGQQLVVLLLVASLLLAWLVSRVFLGVHVVDRLRKVSQYLRFGETDFVCPLIPVQGNDEIGEMARAVEQFLKDRQYLVEAQSALQQSEELMRTMANAVQSGVLLIDDQDCIQFVNPAAERLFGYQQEEMIGTRLHEILLPEPLRQRAREGLAVYARTGAGPLVEKPMEFLARRKDGSEVNVQIAVGRVRKDDHWWAVGAAMDISAHKAREKDLEYQAGTDQLTGVGNRRTFLHLAEHEFRRCRRAKLPVFILMFDLDHFKKINDTYGHAVGDEVLRSFAGVCTRGLRDSDAFGRIGGEEFAAVLTALSRENAMMVAERIRSAFVGVTVRVGAMEQKIQTSVSIGLVRVDPGVETVEGGLRKADEALYQAKEQGRNRVIMCD